MRRLRHLIGFVRARCGETVHQIRNPYRPELYYMRGPGPRWRASHSRIEDAASVAPSRADRAI